MHRRALLLTEVGVVQRNTAVVEVIKCGRLDAGFDRPHQEASLHAAEAACLVLFAEIRGSLLTFHSAQMSNLPFSMSLPPLHTKHIDLKISILLIILGLEAHFITRCCMRLLNGSLLRKRSSLATS